LQQAGELIDAVVYDGIDPGTGPSSGRAARRYGRPFRRERCRPPEREIVRLGKQ
jgi:hypothetical protein